MADTYTTNLNLTKPEPGAAEDTWGISLNSDLDTLDAIFSSSGTQVNLNPNQVNFADGKKAIFGTGSDLEIYHDGSHSYIKDAGTGQIKVLAGTNFQVLDATGTNFAANFNASGESQLYYNGNLKLKTTASGIDVTGTVVSDGLTVDGEGRIEETGNAARLVIARTDGANATESASMDLLESFSAGGSFGTTNNYGFRLDINGSANTFNIKSGSQTTVRKRLQIDRETGDISFYDDTGSTQGLFWDASAESLGLGTTSPAYALDLANASGGNLARFKDSDSSHNGIIIAADTNAGWVGNSASNTGEGIYYQNSINAMRFYANGSEKARLNSSGLDVTGDITASGNIDINSDSGQLQFGADNDMQIFHNGANGEINISTGSFTIDSPGTITLNADESGRVLLSDGTTNYGRFQKGGTSWNFHGLVQNNSFRFLGNDGGTETEVMRIQYDGLVGIGTSSPLAKFHVSTTGQAISRFSGSDATLIVRNAVSNELDLNVAGSGDDLTFSLAGSEKARINWGGNFGIGTTSPSTKLHISSASPILRLEDTTDPQTTDGSIGKIEFYGNDGSSGGAGIRSYIQTVSTNAAGNDHALAIGLSTSNTAATEKLRLTNTGLGRVTTSSTSLEPKLVFVDGSGDYASLEKVNRDIKIKAFNTDVAYFTNGGSVGIGTSSPSAKLHLNTSDTTATYRIQGATSAAIDFYNSTTKNGALLVNSSTFLVAADNSNPIAFNTGGSETARFDASGNLLVAQTTADSTSDGHGLLATGRAYHTMNGNHPLQLNRKTSDGNIIVLQKDGTTVGSIGANAGVMTLDAPNGNKHYVANSALFPSANNILDLGTSSQSYKDLYLSGTANLGGLEVSGANARVVRTDSQDATLKLRSGGSFDFNIASQS
jgi:hypothetical protein